MPDPRDPRAIWEQRYRLSGRRIDPPTPFGLQAATRVASMRTALERAPDVLELGAGTGRDARALAAAGARVVALDVSATGLASLEGVERVTPLVADLREPLPIDASRFDLVYSHLVLSCDFRTEALEQLVAEIERVLRPEGELWVCVRSTDDATYQQSEQRGAGYLPLGETGLHFFSRRSIRRLLCRFTLMRMITVQLDLDGELYGVLEISATRNVREPPAIP